MHDFVVVPSDLEGYPGAPFGDGVVQAALASIRRHAGWHIATEVTETLTVDAIGGTRLILPTLHVTDVTEVRIVRDESMTTATGYRWSAAGILSRSCGWPEGFRTVEVDLTHGYRDFPAELLPVIAAECQSITTGRLVASQSAGPFSQSFRDSGGSYTTTDPALARYTLPTRP